MNTQGMNKPEYLSKLKKYLARLPEAEQNDILRDQEELIRDAVASGRKESEFITSLGDPRAFAASLVAESRIQKLEESTSLNSAVRNSWPAVLALIALAPFNLVFVLGPFLAVIGVLLGFWGTSIMGVVVSGIFIILFFTEALSVSVGPAVHSSAAFMLFGMLFLFLCFSGVTAWFSKVFIKLCIKYLRWNLKLVKQVGE